MWVKNRFCNSFVWLVCIWSPCLGVHSLGFNACFVPNLCGWEARVLILSQYAANKQTTAAVAFKWVQVMQLYAWLVNTLQLVFITSTLVCCSSSKVRQAGRKTECITRWSTQACHWPWVSCTEKYAHYSLGPNSHTSIYHQLQYENQRGSLVQICMWYCGTLSNPKGHTYEDQEVTVKHPWAC